ncbi:MAG TPA: membrane protein insertase, partial [Pseudobdellovibrionaceae bacterium]
MQEQNKGSFFDPKTILAVVLVGAVWFGWQSYLTKKYPQYNKVKTVETTPTMSTPGVTTTPGENVSSTVETKRTPTPQIPEKEYQYHDQNITFTISSRGMGLKNLILNQYVDYDKNPIKLGQSEDAPLFEMKLAAEQTPLNFEFKEESAGSYVGTAQVGESTVTRTLKYNAEKQAFTNKIVI